MKISYIRVLLYLQVIAFSFFCLGCSDDLNDEREGVSSPKSKMVKATIKAQMSEKEELRSGVIYGNTDYSSGEKFIWHEGDKLGIFGLDENDAFIFTDYTPYTGYEFSIINYSNDSTSPSADFSGEMPVEFLQMRKVFAVTNMESYSYNGDKILDFNLKHTEAPQVGKSTEHLAKMDFMYGASKPVTEILADVLGGAEPSYSLPGIRMKHISSMLRYHFVNQSSSDWKVSNVTVSAVDTATKEPAKVFVSKCDYLIDLENETATLSDDYLYVMPSISLFMQESEQDNGGMKMMMGDTIDGYQMIIPTLDLSTSNLCVTVTMSSFDGKTIKKCIASNISGTKVKNGKFESGYRYVINLKITDELLANAKETVLDVSGTGTQDDPYVVSSANGLLGIRDMINSGADAFLNAYYKLNGDIRLPDSINWEPMASNVNKPFNGVFDGAGSSISQLVYNSESGVAKNIALFGYLGVNAVVRDLYVNNVSFNGDFRQSAVIAAENRGTIIGCVVNSGNIGDENTKGIRIGGLVALNYGSIQKSSCLANVYGGSYSGCLVGENWGSLVACYSTGNFTTNDPSVTSQGGLVGESGEGSSIVGCYSKGGKMICGRICGGLVGQFKWGYMVSCYATGTAEILSVAANSYAGDLIGKYYGDVFSYCATPNGKGNEDVGIGFDLSNGSYSNCLSHASDLHSVVTAVPADYNAGVIKNGTVVVDGEVYSLGQALGKLLWKEGSMPSLFWE